MSALDELLAANERYAASFTKGDLPVPPARKVAVLTCMDARLDPERFLGLEEGDAHVIRNAGGRASDDAIRSLIISCNLLDAREILVIHHEDCGMTKLWDDRAVQVEKNTGEKVAAMERDKGTLSIPENWSLPTLPGDR